MAPQIAVSHGPEDSLLEDALLEHDASLRVSRLIEVHSEPAVAAGENFASDISRANADVLLAGGRRRRMSLIAKRMPSREAQVGFLQEHSFFDTEIMMYAELLPHLEDALRGQGVSPLWPDYLGQKGNYLIFSDLKSKNYRVPHRLERLDLDHAMLAMKAIALFHGSSVVAKASGRLDKLIPRLEPTFMLRETAALKRITEGGFRACGQAILKDWGSKWQDIGERLVKRSQTVSEELLRLGRVDDSRLNVVNHGDLWTTNLMFKYSKLVDRPVGLRFIDFQLSHYNSYAYDLIYFLNTSIPPSIRLANQERLLSCYRRTLAECLSGAGLEHLLPSLEDIQRELRRLELYRLSILICILPMQIAQVEGAFNFDNLISDNEDHFAQHPEVYSTEFFDEVHLELIKMDQEGGVF